MLPSSAPIGSPLNIPATILGVFAYLDQVLPAAMRERFAAEDIGIGPGDQCAGPSDLREQGREVIKNSFPLKDDSATLCQDLAVFRLFHSSDKADALAAAYGLRTRGLDPLRALNADYAIRSGGILHWADMPEMLAEAEKDPAHAYRRLHQHIRKGDRVAHYSLSTSWGLMVVRGDRLVCKVTTLNMSIEGDPKKYWQPRVDAWEAAGGYKAFFASQREKIQ